MARQIGSGWRSSVSARVVTLAAVVCAGTLAFAVPALADDDSGGSGGHSTSSHRTVRDDDTATDSPSDTADDASNGGTSTGAADSTSGGTSNSGTTKKNRSSTTSTAPSSRATASDDDSDRSSTTNPNLVKGTPCTKTARACVDLKTQRAWLINSAGVVTTGPVPVSSGGPGEETPAGTFAVQWKDKNHVSQESKLPNGQGAPMPYSVFFADGGVAFHGGSLRRASGGCVHLDDSDAITFYNTLNTGDQVQVH